MMEEILQRLADGQNPVYRFICSNVYVIVANSCQLVQHFFHKQYDAKSMAGYT
jgi:hypothetical protein